MQYFKKKKTNKQTNNKTRSHKEAGDKLKFMQDLKANQLKTIYLYLLSTIWSPFHKPQEVERKGI